MKHGLVTAEHFTHWQFNPLSDVVFFGGFFLSCMPLTAKVLCICLLTFFIQLHFVCSL